MPIIQLDFNNPLNTSVQVGDTAYFSNPSPVPGNMQHVHGVQPPPHDTSGQDEIIKIGEIIAIGDWNGTVSSIQCDMDQALFNKYAGQITTSACVVNYNNPISVYGDCASKIIMDQWPINYGAMYLVQNPTAINTDYAFHYGIGVPPGGYQGGNPSATAAQKYPTAPLPFQNFPTLIDPPLCSVMQGIKNVNFVATNSFFHVLGDDWHPDLYNFWAHPKFVVQGGFATNSAAPGAAATDWINNYAANPHSWNDLLNLLISYYPADFSIGMNFDDVTSLATRQATGITVTGDGFEGSTYSYFAMQHLGFIGNNVWNGGYTYGVICGDPSFIMFSKDNKVNQLDMLGYYAAVEYRNNSTEEAELFNVGTTYFGSSK